MFLYFLQLQGEHRQIRRSGELVAEQEIRDMDLLQEEHDMFKLQGSSSVR